MPLCSARSINLPLTYSKPLSTLIALGAPPFDDPVQGPHDTFGRQRKVHLDARPLTIEVVRDVQQPKAPSVTRPDPP